MSNLILDSDSYKASHYLQYPPDTEALYSYIESRGGHYPRLLFFGLQPILYRLVNAIDNLDIDEAEETIVPHGLPFNREGWERICDCLGYLPVRIRAVPEGQVVSTNTPLVTIESTDPDSAWLVSYLETMLVRVWYPITVATQSWHIKQLIKTYLSKTANDLSGLDFKLHDFGARGVSSQESAQIGGAAHLVNFKGSDTMTAIGFIRNYYSGGDQNGLKHNYMPAFSIPAAEHSTVTAWGKDHEADAYKHIVRSCAKPGGLVAVVSDSYDLHSALRDIWGSDEMRKVVRESGATVVVRPDSGDPAEITLETLKLLAARYGYQYTKTGHMLLNNVRVIQGDGVNEDSIGRTLATVAGEMFSTDNIAFGMGGKLLQDLTRDTQRFAMKLSAIKRHGLWYPVRKEPKTDPSKTSKAGRVGAELPVVFEDGDVKVSHNFEEIRARSNSVVL